jgi:intermediate filament protein if
MSQSNIKTTTVYETRSSSSSASSGAAAFGGSVSVGGGTDLPVSYRPSIAPRNLIIQRTSYGGGGGSGGRSVAIERSSHYGSLSAGVPAGAYATVTTTGVTNVKESRAKEKKDMQDLNERFASYIEKVRFLEAQNRRLADELEKLKARWGKETTQIKAMYQVELDEARKGLDVADKEKARLEIRVASLEEQLEEFRQRLDEANRLLVEERERNILLGQQLSSLEGEVNPLRRHIETLTRDQERDKKRISQLQEALNRTRVDLDNETLLHIDAENRFQTLTEELEFLKAVHEQELKELAALAYRDTTAENREFWKNEMGQALREISQVYEDKLEGMRGELETFYNLKMQEFRTGATRQQMDAAHAKDESKTLRSQVTDIRDKNNALEARLAAALRELDELRRQNQDRERELESENNEYKIEITKLRAELDAILKELENILDTKLGLELEIAAYRKLLEGEETRSGLRQLVDTIGQSYGGGGSSSLQQQSYRYSETSSASGVSGAAYSSSSAYGAGGGAGGATSDRAVISGAGGGATSTTTQVVKGEMSAKTTYQRSAKGPVAIAESSADGKVIVVENTGRKDEDLNGWRLRRNIDGLDKADFVFDSLIVAPVSKIRIWAKGTRPVGASASTDLEYPEASWGVGSSIVTKLVNANGEDRATHTQKTVYT